jgi:hypothetical protein
MPKNGSTGFQPVQDRQDARAGGFGGGTGGRQLAPQLLLGFGTRELLANAPLLPVRIIFVPWLIPNWARAQTWWNVVLVRRGVRLTKRLLAHELTHVLQWRSLGVWGFMCRYARHLITHSYEHHPLEIVARLAEQDDFYLNWAQEILNSAKKG